MADEKTPALPTHAAQPTPEQLRQQAQATRAAAEAHQRTATEGVDARAALVSKSNAEFYEQEAAGKPTPTQHESDLAKVGALDIDAKEDDGSGPQMVPVTIRVPEGGQHSEPYKRKTK
jgi:hypothetical protein